VDAGTGKEKGTSPRKWGGASHAEAYGGPSATLFAEVRADLERILLLQEKKRKKSRLGVIYWTSCFVFFW